MSLKDLTSAKHREAESTEFMKAVFSKTLPSFLWADWTLQKTLFYKTIEGCAGSNGLLNDLPDIQRAFYLYLDYRDKIGDNPEPKFRASTIDYHYYLLGISKDPKRIMAHLYTWHMGDLFGGQMIKRIVPGKHRSLEFKDPALLIENIRKKLDDSMADEANHAFDWAIKMMKDYDACLG